MPVDPISRGRQPGYQKSETSSAELTIYPNGNDPILPSSGPRIDFVGRRIEDAEPSLIAVNTSKSLNGGGSWSATVKTGTPFGKDTDLRDIIVDDDWADITLLRHNRPWHVMRGLVNDVRKATTVGASGATTQVYTISGRDFGVIWEKTPLWFNKYITPGNEGENIVGGLALQVFGALSGLTTVDQTVRAFLFGFLQRIGQFGRANWKMPRGIPNVRDETTFIENVDFDTLDFANDPPRLAINPNFMDPNGANAWAMAQEWSDPGFCELWYDIASKDRFIEFVFSRELDQLRPEDTKMVLFLRDRPFPTIELGLDSPWFSLPTIEVNREDIKDDDVGRGGTERFNAFFLSPQITQELMGTSAIEITAPLWAQRDMLVHGFRRFDIMSKYKADLTDPKVSGGGDTSLLTLTKGQRTRIRDWYAMNPYLYNGNIALAHGRPDARVGMRLRIPGRTDERTETYYIEGVGHNWQFGPGIRTNFDVTRGWIGTDESYMSALRTLANRYGGNRQGDFTAGGIGGGTAIA